MRTNLFTTIVLIIGSLFWSCNSDELLVNTEENVILKGGHSGFQSLCNPIKYEMVAGMDTHLGYLEVSNNQTVLHVQYIADESVQITEVQLWVGVNKNNVPMNRNKIPIPGKFTYKASGKISYEFNIELNTIYNIPEMLLEGKLIYLFAHASFVNKESGKVESAWSEGQTFGTNRLGTYSEFSCCHPVGNAGCFPHKALGGVKINADYYYDNTIKGKQNITADLGENIGFVINDNQNIKFYFNQDWMFTDLGTPEVTITGYYAIGEEGHEIYSGPPFSAQPPVYYYFGPVSHYNYYKIELNVQYCSTF